MIPIEFLLLGFLAVTAVVIARLDYLFAAAMLTGIFSLLSAGLFTLMDAVDVAFTEAAVGAGVSTVLMLGTLSLTVREERKRPVRFLPFLIVVLTGGALFVGTLDMPAYGDPAAPIHNYLAPDYIAGAEAEFGLPNIVTAILGSYRGFDTLGETAVIFTAALGVMALLASGRVGNRVDKK
jgi:multicomponent Na+:H+ antiporter subunit B